jgi:hypothetical protein
MSFFTRTMQAKDQITSNCQCHQPPFHYESFNTLSLGEDSLGAEITIDTCKKCGQSWLKLLIEQPHHSKSGRWWRVAVSAENCKTLVVANTRAFIEQQSECFVGGSFFESTGHRVNAPIKIL